MLNPQQNVLTATSSNLIKTCFIGPSNSGKTSICSCLKYNDFKCSQISTIGVDFFNYNYQLKNGSTCIGQMWDTAGQERFLSNTSTVTRGSMVLIFVFDITQPDQFCSSPDSPIHRFKTFVKNGNTIPIVLVLLNKSDLITEEEAQSRLEQVTKLFKEDTSIDSSINFSFATSSAKERSKDIFTSVNEVLEKAVAHKEENAASEALKQNNILLNEVQTNNKSNSCCF